MSKIKCVNCDKEFVRNKYNPGQKYCCKKCGRQHYYKINREIERKQSRDWYKKNREDEIKKNRQYREENRELFNWYHNKDRFNGVRDVVLSRDRNMCRVCGSTSKLSVHHKDGTGYSSVAGKDIESNNDINNLISLCGSCHHKLHHWQKKEGSILIKDEDIVRTIRELIEADSKSQR